MWYKSTAFPSHFQGATQGWEKINKKKLILSLSVLARPHLGVINSVSTSVTMVTVNSLLIYRNRGLEGTSKTFFIKHKKLVTDIWSIFIWLCLKYNFMFYSPVPMEGESRNPETDSWQSEISCAHTLAFSFKLGNLASQKLSFVSNLETIVLSFLRNILHG